MTTSLNHINVFIAVVCLTIASGADGKPLGESVGRKPFFDAREHRTEYTGPGRETSPPEDVESVLIGYFGSSDPDDPEGGDMWRAAQLAIEEANADGGYRGKPFRLVSGWSKDPWGTGVVQVTRMAYDEKVWAIVGGIDGASTHLAEQVVAKARLTLVNPVSTDKTINLANVPWVFSCVPGDDILAGSLAEEIAARVRNESFGNEDNEKGVGSHLCEAPEGPFRQMTPDPFFVCVSSDDHDSRMLTDELKKRFVEHRLSPQYHFRFKQQRDGVHGAVATQVLQTELKLVVVVAGTHDSARLIKTLRAGGFAGTIFGGPSMGRRRFLEEGGLAAEGVVFPLLYCCGNEDGKGVGSHLCEAPEGPFRQMTPDPFSAVFQHRFQVSPDYTAARTYDAVHLVVAAIREAGLNRAQIRDAVKKLTPWPGVAGTINWDNLGGNPQPVLLGTVKNGRIIPFVAAQCDDNS